MGTNLNESLNPLTGLEYLARLPSHRGDASLQIDGVTVTGQAEFVLPAEQNAIVAFVRDSDDVVPGGDFAANLKIEGTHDGEAFRIDCAQCYTRLPSVGLDPRLSLITPINGPVRLQYGVSRPAHLCTVLLNNFDYEYGDAFVDDSGVTRQATPLTVDAGGRKIQFRWHPDHQALLARAKAYILSRASLTEFSFEPVVGEDDETLLLFAQDVATICTFARGASVSVAMLEMRDAQNAVVRRIITQPIKSQFITREVIPDHQLPRLFQEGFSTFVTMRESHSVWTKLHSYCGSVEDSPYLEQKFASLMMALEFFMRNCLIERGQPPNIISTLTLDDLIGATRRILSWNVPKHYTAKHVTRLLRNAVMHGGELPMKDNAEFRHLFDKWRLFLYRRVLIRLGYTGDIVSPFAGIESLSSVGDFSVEHNSFEPHGAAADALRRFHGAMRTKTRKTS
jgi:hypothetical protein